MIQDVRAEWLVCGTRNLLMWQADVVAAAAEKSESSAQKGVSRGHGSKPSLEPSPVRVLFTIGGR